MIEFKRADGFVVCDGCGATYSDVLSVCPQCEAGAAEGEGGPTRRFLCNEKEPCPVGGADGVCCVSCDRLQKCRRVCPTASSYGGAQPGEDDVLCEYMEVGMEFRREKDERSKSHEEVGEVV